jgi:hypothetical protein
MAIRRTWRNLAAFAIALGVLLVNAAVAAACTGGADWPRPI